MTYDTTKATRDGVFVITYQDDFVYINKNLKIKVNQLQILEMFSVDTTSHTDYSMLKVYLTGNKVDSIYEPGKCCWQTQIFVAIILNIQMEIVLN